MVGAVLLILFLVEPGDGRLAPVTTLVGEEDGGVSNTCRSVSSCGEHVSNTCQDVLERCTHRLRVVLFGWMWAYCGALVR